MFGLSRNVVVMACGKTKALALPPLSVNPRHVTLLSLLLSTSRGNHSCPTQQLPHNKGKWKPFEDEMLRNSVRQHRDNHGQINWAEVKLYMEGTRSYQQCLDRWSKHLKFQEEHKRSSSTNAGVDSLHNYWTDTEDAMLTRAMVAYAYQTKDGKAKVNWNQVVSVFKGTRTYLQCYLRWYSVLHPRKIFRSGTWSPAEDAILSQAMMERTSTSTKTTNDSSEISERSKDKDWWRHVSSLLGDSRSPKQCRLRWNALQPREYMQFGRWSPEEDFELKSAIATYMDECSEEEDTRAINWKKIADSLRNANISRTALQCRARAGYYESLNNTDPWSAAEDSMLKSLVREFGTVGSNGGIHWEAVGKRMTDRGVFQCRTRWFEHVKLDGRRRRGAFSPSEDKRLIAAVVSVRESFSSEFEFETPRRGFWLKVGESFGPTRSYKQCRQRWTALLSAREEEEEEEEEDSSDGDSDSDGDGDGDDTGGSV